ncbi:MAG: hypothetical protein IPK94_08335 [Saprospiraceae bacterium]|nr:hypothetical protein [Saprospiraceae bacterium]
MTEEEINKRRISFKEIEARAQANIAKGFNGKAIIAFIDLLGFSNEINTNWSKNPDPLLRIMKLKAYWDILNDRKATNLFFEYDETTLIIETKYPEVITFSDSFILVLPLDNENPTTILASILTVTTSILEIWRNCIDEGFTIRGGVDYNEVYHNGLDIVGPGLITAYEMESKKAKISRILISDNIKKNN